MIAKIKNKFAFYLQQIKIKKQLKLIFTNYDLDKFNDRSIIIFAGIGHMYISPFEILMYHLLRKKGFEVKYLIYNKDIPVNEVITQTVIKKIGRKNFWNKSVDNATKLLSSSNVKYEFINYNNDIFKLNKIEIPDTLDKVLSFNYDGINFGEIIKGSLYRYYKSLTFGDDVFEVAIDNLKVSLSNYSHIKKIKETAKIDLVLMSHGIYTTWEPIVEFCKLNNINFICYDRAKTKNNINLNINQNSPNWDFSNAWNRYKNKELNSFENNLVDTYLKERELQKGDVFSYNFSKKELDIGSLKNRLGIKNDIKIITIFTNLIWDAANVSRDIAFKDPLECIIKTIEYYKSNNKVQIVIRSHPAEKVLGTHERYSDLVKAHFNSNLPENVTIIEPEDSINSFSIIEMSSIGVVNTSTVGLEFAIEGKPIILISDTNYRNKGFTFDVKNEKEYFSTLDSQLEEISLKKNQIKLARKYFYIMMFLYQCKIPVKYVNGVFDGYQFDSLDSIINDPSIKNIMNTINNIDSKSDFINW
jgi:hypothetical protein